MDIPSNCFIEKIERTITDNGIPTVLDVDRCVPEVSRNTLSVSVYGNTTKLVFSLCTAAERVNLRAVHEFNLASGYIAPDDDERKRESKRCSISRTKRIVTELVASNTWEWFITITLDASKWNRHNPTGLQECIKEFFRTIRNTKINGKKPFRDASYLVVPECHQDGAIHLHGVLHNYPLDKLIEYHEDPTVPMPEFILRELKNGRKVFHSVDFDQIFGFNTLNLIQDQDRAASYIAKYLTKSDGESPFKTRVWHSRGLQQAQKIKKYHIPTEKNAVEELFDIMRKLASVTASGRPLFEEHYTTGISIPVSATCLINQSDMTVGEIVLLLDNMLGDEVKNG